MLMIYQKNCIRNVNLIMTLDHETKNIDEYCYLKKTFYIFYFGFKTLQHFNSLLSNNSSPQWFIQVKFYHTYILTFHLVNSKWYLHYVPTVWCSFTQHMTSETGSLHFEDSSNNAYSDSFFPSFLDCLNYR